MAARIPPPPTSEQQQLAAAVAADLQDQAAAIVQEVANLLATLPDAQLFGDTEFLVRDKILQLVAHSYQARLAQKKMATSAPASTAPAAEVPPPSTATANETP